MKMGWGKLPKEKVKALIPIKETTLLNTRLAETIVAVANRVKEVRSIRKQNLRDIIGTQSRTFSNAVKYLIDLGLVRESLKYPPATKRNARMNRKLKYLVWIGFQTNDIVESLDSLIAYQQLDLLKYPVRDLHKLNTTQVLLLKKYLFRIVNKSIKVIPSKLKKVFKILNVEDPIPVTSVTKLYNLGGSQLYSCLWKLMVQGKIEIGIIKDKRTKRNRVVIYKDPDWVFTHTRWKCENCGHRNNGSNIYCGRCGDKR